MNAQRLSAEDPLEQRIEQARIAMTHAENTEGRRTWWEEMRGLIHQRSHAQIERMESRLPKPWGARRG